VSAVRLKKNQDRRLRSGHPRVFSNENEEYAGPDEDGDILDVMDHRGAFLGRGYVNRRSLIALRILTRGRDEIDAAFFAKNFERALAYREGLYPGDDALRVVNAEGDGLPGLIVDRYGDVLALQALTRGIAQRADRLAELAAEVTGARTVYRRGDPTAAAIEGFDDRSGWLVGQATATIEIREGPCLFQVDLEEGQKTGFYLDQRENRALVGSRAAGRRVLDAFAYTGAFAAWALQGGATDVLALDSSGPACARAVAHLARNAPPDAPGRYEVREVNVFDALRALEREGNRFDLIVLDPPPFTRRRAAVDAAMRGYKEINLRAIRCLRPGGLLATFSCSHHVSSALFEDVCRAAVEDVGRTVRIVSRVDQARDHPVLLAVPETRYLTGLVLEALE